MRHAILRSGLFLASAVFIGSTGFGLAGGKKSASSPGLDRKAAAVSKTTILMKDCRIKLIRQVTLASDRTGILDFVEPHEGDRVAAGRKIAALRSAVAAAALATAEARATNDVDVRYAVKAAELAQVEYEKALQANRQVPKGGLPIVPDIEVRRLKLKAEGNRLQIKKAELEQQINRLMRDEAKATLVTYQIVAPFDGIVTRMFKSAGEAVRQGDPILELTNTAWVRVEGYVGIGNLSRVKPGTPVTVGLDIPTADPAVKNKVFEGRIVFVDVSAEPVTSRIRVWAKVANPDNILKAGLKATMMLDSVHKKPAGPTKSSVRTPHR